VLLAGVALSILVWQARAAIVLTPLPRVTVNAGTLAIPVLEDQNLPADDALIVQTVAGNPFREDRRRAAGRYRLPGETVETEPESALPLPPEFGVTGVAVGSGRRSLVALVLGRSESRLLCVGDTVHGFSVSEVSREHVSLERQDTTIVLPVPDPFRQATNP